MLCDNCHERDAVVTLTQVGSSGVTQLRLCEKCAAERGVETTITMPKHPLGDFLQAVQQQGGAAQPATTACSFCAMTLSEFKSTGRLGCARCYSAFEGSLRELLRRVHGNARHVGRRYDPPAVATLARASTLLELRDQLRRAIESEEFELAASLRDQIRVLE